MHLGKIFFSKLLLTHCVGRSIRRLSRSCKRVFNKMKWAMSPRTFFFWMYESRRSAINWLARFPGGRGDIQSAETSMTVLESIGFNQGQTCSIVSRAHIRPRNSLCKTAVHNTPGWHWETQHLFWISFAYLESFRIYSLGIAVWEWGRSVINQILLMRTGVLRDAVTASK